MHLFLIAQFRLFSPYLLHFDAFHLARLILPISVYLFLPHSFTLTPIFNILPQRLSLCMSPAGWQWIFLVAFRRCNPQWCLKWTSLEVWYGLDKLLYFMSCSLRYFSSCKFVPSVFDVTLAQALLDKLISADNLMPHWLNADLESFICFSAVFICSGLMQI